jgi:transcriptional regulator with XRE-family HTH domain
MDKKYANVSELINDVSDDEKFNKSVEKEINDKQIAKMLFAMRCKAGKNQAQVAAAMGCTQGKVSKLESSLDADISIGDLVKYCSAVNMRLEVGFFDCRLRMVDMVKYHFFRLKGLLSKMIDMAKGDDAMERGIEKFMGEAFFNINLGLFQCLEKAKVKRKNAATLHVSPPVNFGEVDEGAQDNYGPPAQNPELKKAG